MLVYIEGYVQDTDVNTPRGDIGDGVGGECFQWVRS